MASAKNPYHFVEKGDLRQPLASLQEALQQSWDPLSIPLIALMAGRVSNVTKTSKINLHGCKITGYGEVFDP